MHKYIQTYDNDDDYSGSICRVSHHAFSNEYPFYRSLYFGSLVPMAVEDNVDNGNMALPNVGPSNDTLTSPHPPLSNCIRLRHTHIYHRKDIILLENFSHILSVAISNNIYLLCSGTNFGILSSSSLSLTGSLGFAPIRPFW